MHEHPMKNNLPRLRTSIELRSKCGTPAQGVGRSRPQEYSRRIESCRCSRKV